MEFLILGILVVVCWSFVQAAFVLLVQALWPIIKWALFWWALIPYYLLRWAFRVATRPKTPHPQEARPSCVVYQFPRRS